MGLLGGVGFVGSVKSPKSMASSCLAGGAVTLGAALGSCFGASPGKESGSGLSLELAHRRVTYFVLMKLSIFPSFGTCPDSSCDSQ